MTHLADYVLLRDPGADISHAVNAHEWERFGAPPRTRCGERVGPRWVTTATARHRSDLLHLDNCCDRCKAALSSVLLRADEQRGVR